ncbi:TatD family hydrolase [Waterburya agarophytonicola K14]|uniref:D-aminoacyl-tRNA deacylase n=1 Tax=Waterburya agarophytonicola KI4 TaxID=2874699 RepID=A0A964BWI8_9CYAN|nr:TatD family hydrolase [Waterburya agarophytonicola]MCC0179057.1 TatD family hydrolase [Waterburya agarophytonicola KI4]
MQLIDTHVHINFDVFQGNLSSLRQRWQDAGVVHLVHSCVEPKEFQGIQSLADRFPELSFAIGLHPLDVDKWQDDTAAKIKSLAGSDRRVVAIGETGLDFYKADNQEKQILVLKEQLRIAQELDKPVIIHCRNAATKLKEVLTDFWATEGSVRGVMHCWGGDESETKWFLDLGFYISYSGIVTFKNAKQVQDSSKIVPSDRLLVETDCPFLAPVPHRGKTNEPSFVRDVAEYLANLHQTDLETIAQQTTANACRLFNIQLESQS